MHTQISPNWATSLCSLGGIWKIPLPPTSSPKPVEGACHNIPVYRQMPFTNYLYFNPFPTFIVPLGFFLCEVAFPFLAPIFYSGFKPLVAQRFLFLGLAGGLKAKTAPVLAVSQVFPFIFGLVILYYLLQFLRIFIHFKYFKNIYYFGCFHRQVDQKKSIPFLEKVHLWVDRGWGGTRFKKVWRVESYQNRHNFPSRGLLRHRILITWSH